MSGVSIIGVGQTRVDEHWGKSIKQLAAEAISEALADAAVEAVDALYVGNMLAGELTGQEHLGVLISDYAGLPGVEAFRVEAACASGAAAFRAGVMAVASGAAKLCVVVGVEKMTDRPGAEVTAGLASAADADFEAEMGLSFVAMNALLMRRYMHEHGVPHEAFAPFVVNAHENARRNPHAMFHFPVTAEEFLRAKMIADPVNLLDSAPLCDGAAALVLCSRDSRPSPGRPSVHVRACASATDTIALHDRRNPIELDAAAMSARRAYEQARVEPADLQFCELHDAFTIMAALSLEACGLAPRGRGTEAAASGAITRGGRLPISTMGGLKARGHPVGATGTYQLVEVALQLLGRAGANQLDRAELGMAQNIGGSGATVVTTILEADR